MLLKDFLQQVMQLKNGEAKWQLFKWNIPWKFSQDSQHRIFFTESKTICRIYVLNQNCGLEGKIGDVILELDEKKYRINEVEALQVMGTMITKEADSISAMHFRRMKAARVFGMDIKI